MELQNNICKLKKIHLCILIYWKYKFNLLLKKTFGFFQFVTMLNLSYYISGFYLLFYS